MTDFRIILFLAGLGVVVTILHMLLKQAGREEYAYLILVFGITIALIKVVPLILELFHEVESVFYYF